MQSLDSLLKDLDNSNLDPIEFYYVQGEIIDFLSTNKIFPKKKLQFIDKFTTITDKILEKSVSEEAPCYLKDFLDLIYSLNVEAYKKTQSRIRKKEKKYVHDSSSLELLGSQFLSRAANAMKVKLYIENDITSGLESYERYIQAAEIASKCHPEKSLSHVISAADLSAHALSMSGDTEWLKKRLEANKMSIKMAKKVSMTLRGPDKKEKKKDILSRTALYHSYVADGYFDIFKTRGGKIENLVQAYIHYINSAQINENLEIERSTMRSKIAYGRAADMAIGICDLGRSKGITEVGGFPLDKWCRISIELNKKYVEHFDPKSMNGELEEDAKKVLERKKRDLEIAEMDLEFISELCQSA